MLNLSNWWGSLLPIKDQPIGWWCPIKPGKEVNFYMLPHINLFLKTALVRFLLLILSRLVVIEYTRSVKNPRYYTSFGYPKIEVDTPPVVEKHIPLDYEQILQKRALEEKPIKPVKSRCPIPKNIVCSHCGAPHIYIYSNGHAPIKDKKHPAGRVLVQQFYCKVCNKTFRQFSQRERKKTPIYRCPYCLKILERMPERCNANFDVYKCRNKRCPYRLKRLTVKQTKLLDGRDRKISYIYREYKLKITDLILSKPENAVVDFSNIYFSLSAVALALVFYVNIGCSARETAYLLKTLYGVGVSHQTILNWMNSIAVILYPFFANFAVKVSHTIVADETYIRIEGRWGYLFFAYDPKRHVILSWHISLKRDTKAASTLLYNTFSHCKDRIHTFVSDGNPIYQLALQFLALRQIAQPNHRIVKGLENEDLISELYRPEKEAVERLIRTFKHRYHNTHGFKSKRGAITFTTLFGIWYNFLRPHMATKGKPPIELVDTSQHLAKQWNDLIEIASDSEQNSRARKAA